MTELEPKTNTQTKIFIAAGAIMFALIILFVLFGMKKEEPKRNIVEYNYFKFEETGGLWKTNIQLDDQLFEAMFRYNPKQVENVTITGNFTGFRKTPIYITFDPDVESDKFKYLALAASELSLNVIRALNFTVEAACTKNETEACQNRSIITCADNKSVIYLVAEGPTQITLNQSCITLNGEQLELLKSVDRLLFQWYKIMKTT
ncbi:hypothetical protein KY319_02275 [Candidatus Woesearchaeota archaeon]|nr:hypothetical protein [Candidatus Woesearchaeota archaeon]